MNEKPSRISPENEVDDWAQKKTALPTILGALIEVKGPWRRRPWRQVTAAQRDAVFF